MRSIKGSLVGLVLAGILALTPTAAFAHNGGGGGHGGGGFGGGGHGAGGGSGHFVGGSHFAGFAGRSFAGHSSASPGFAQHQGAFFAGRGNDFRHGDRDHFRHEGSFFFGDPFGYDYPYYGYDYPYYGYYDDNAGGQMPSQEIVMAVQKELTQLGYYRGRVDGLIGPETESAIRWFQSIDKLPVTGQIDDPTLKALRIS